MLMNTAWYVFTGTSVSSFLSFFFFQAEDGIRDLYVTGVQTLCSSDLAASRGAEGDPSRRHARSAAGLGAGAGAAPVDGGDAGGRLLAQRRPQWCAAAERPAGHSQIGRASCRERVEI